MRLRLRPREPELYEFFTRAARNAAEAAEALAELGSADTGSEELSNRLVEIEHRNDELTHELYNRLNATFVTPFDRDDMYRLGSRLDDVVDHLEAAATLTHLYQPFADVTPPPELLDQVSVLRKLGALTVTAFDDLAAGRDLRHYWVESNSLENEADKLYRMLLVRLFGGEYETLTVLKLKEIADELEEAADAFELVANTVEAIAVKES
ncbi:DUF47 domain-containing protein [Amycolatopsis suaedae]|uniref:DUF47 family protein n=1 Tax=Amycolatopsis suaedae TaxID=2510978 RepID=A0A4V2EKW5_9PSEU|nr:DUF47 family protein [Amycolatopsis suaedae]RZQ59485.1 DUF47 family protein [Amycolatopsis suaedae]